MKKGRGYREWIKNGIMNLVNFLLPGIVKFGGGKNEQTVRPDYRKENAGMKITIRNFIGSKEIKEDISNP